MTPAELNLTIFEGADFNRRITWEISEGVPVDVTNMTARMHIRNLIDSTSFIDITPFITVGGVNGQIDIAIPASNTIDWGYTSGVYDLEVEESTGEVYKLLYGKVTIIEEVTR